MRPIKGSELACIGFNIVPMAGQPTAVQRCACCAGFLNGFGHVFFPPKTFGDLFHFAEPAGSTVCGHCEALLKSAETQTFTASGVVTLNGFKRLLSNRERLAFLLSPPEPPFAVTIITTKRQHAWWMARVSYDKNLILLQFGHRQMVIDRLMSIAAADAVLAYEHGSKARLGRTACVFHPLSRDMKSSRDGRMTLQFCTDDSAEAREVRRVISHLSLGDIWAMSQIRAAANELGCHTACAAFEVLNSLLQQEQRAA